MSQFDVFLAHNTQDKPQVKAIAFELKQRNIKSWLDEEQIPPGRSFQDEIQQAIALVKSAAIFIGSQGLGRWQSWELKVFITQCIENKIPVIPVLLPGVSNLPEDLVFLKELRWVAFSNRVDDEVTLDLLQWGITGQKPDSSAQLEQKPGDIPPKIVLKEVERLSYELNEKKLYNALLKLDFHAQVSFFREFVEHYSVGACIIHGEQGCGQQWLLSRLINHIPNKKSAKLIRVGLNTQYRPRNINNISADISSYLFPQKYKPSDNEIVNAIYKCLQSQSVIIIFFELDRMPEIFIKEFIDNLWTKVVEKACANSNHSHKLLMFLVDDTSCVEKWTITLTNSYENNWKPELPIKLPIIEKLSPDVLTGWIDNHMLNEFPIQQVKQLKSGIHSFLERCHGGFPESVLEEICKECGHNFSEMKNRWRI